MAETLKTWWLPNGVVVEIIDESIENSKDSWTIKLAVKGTIEVKTTYVDDFEEEPDYLEILSMILPTTEYCRDIVKAGVRAGKITSEKTFLIDAFEKEALAYFEREDFPERYLRKLYKELEKGLSAKRAIIKNDSEQFL